MAVLGMLLDILVDPESKAQLRLEGNELVAADGRRYPIRNGIPRFVTDLGAGQQQTADAFGFKWGKVDTYEEPALIEIERQWMMTHHGWASARAAREYLEAHSPVLDLGCGGGLGTSLWMDGWSGQAWVGVEISSAIDIARNRLGGFPGTHFVQADIMALPFRPRSFRTVTSEGALHHTPSTRNALAAAAEMVAPGGELQFYVYRRKAPIREFTDDFVRQRLAAMSPAEAWESLRPLTKLGRALAELEATVTLDEPVDLLGIPAGSHDVQRLIYWHIAKLYWNPDVSFEANVHINFDWYAPQYAHRQTEEEIRTWCRELGLNVEWFYSELAGYTVHASRPE